MEEPFVRRVATRRPPRASVATRRGQRYGALFRGLKPTATVKSRSARGDSDALSLIVWPLTAILALPAGLSIIDPIATREAGAMLQTKRVPAMVDVFDPYHKWLAIPPEEQPPHHYRLLGIKLFESDPDVIESAAD